MDLFFNTTKKEERTYTIGKALEHVFSTSRFYGILNMSIRGKVVCTVLCDARGAGVYQFKTLSGPFAVAEAVYGPARDQLNNTYEGPPEPLPGSFELPEENRRKILITFGRPADADADADDDFEFI